MLPPYKTGVTRKKADVREHVCFNLKVKESIKLLNLDLSAGSGELLLESLSVVLGDRFLNGLRSLVNESLSFLQTKTGDLADSLDDGDLVSAGGLQDNVELSLLFLSSTGVGNRTGNGNSSGGGNAELILNSVYEISELENCESL